MKQFSTEHLTSSNIFYYTYSVTYLLRLNLQVGEGEYKYFLRKCPMNPKSEAL